MGQHELDNPSGLAETVERLRRESPLPGRPSLSDLAYEARQHGASPKLDGSALSKVLSGSRPYDIELLEALARALGHDPAEFEHYRLATARQLLDERIVGLDNALDTLKLVEAALQQRTARLLATAAAPQGSTDRQLRATGSEGPNPPANDEHGT